MTAVVAAVPLEVVQTAVLLVVEPVSPGGVDRTVEWRPVAGATGAVVDRALVAVSPQTSGIGQNQGVVTGARSGVTKIDVTNPSPSARVRGVRIPGLKRIDGENEFPISGSGDLAGFRLAVTPLVGGQEQAPVVAVPALPKRKALPAQLTGGALSGHLLTLPDLVVERFLITLVDGDAPEDFERQTFDHGDVELLLAPYPTGIHVDGPDGSTQFSMAAPVTGRVDVDLKAAVQRHLTEAVQGDADVASIQIRSDVEGLAAVSLSTDWTIQRSLDDPIEVTVTGDDALAEVPAPRPGRTPATVRADIVVNHHGRGLHPVSDHVPLTQGASGGPMVRDVVVERQLSVASLEGSPIVAVAVIGSVHEEADLTLTVNDVTAQAHVGLAVDDSTGPPSVLWFELDEAVVPGGPVTVALTATRGAFRWIADPEPLVRIAIATEATGEFVMVGDVRVDLTDTETFVAQQQLGPGDSWVVASDQFCDVSLKNLTLEFAP